MLSTMIHLVNIQCRIIIPPANSFYRLSAASTSIPGLLRQNCGAHRHSLQRQPSEVRHFPPALNSAHSSIRSTETILLLRSLSAVEAQYLSRSTNKINEAVGGARVPPGASEGINVARIVVNELDAARFDPLLVRAVAKNAATCLDNILKRLENMVGLMQKVVRQFPH